MIIAVAIRTEQDTYELPRPNRHHHLIRRLAGMGHSIPITGEQGFIDDQRGFVTREEAFRYYSARLRGRSRPVPPQGPSRTPQEGDESLFRRAEIPGLTNVEAGTNKEAGAGKRTSKGEQTTEGSASAHRNRAR